MHWLAYTSIIITVALVCLSIFTGFSKKYDSDTYIIWLVAGLFFALIVLGAVCGTVEIQSVDIKLKSGEYFAARGKYKYLIEYYYTYNNKSCSGSKIGDDIFTYNAISDSTDLDLTIKLNSYGVKMSEQVELTKSKTEVPQQTKVSIIPMAYPDTSKKMVGMKIYNKDRPFLIPVWYQR